MWKRKKHKNEKNNLITQIPKKFNRNMNYNFLNTQNYVRWKQNVAKSYMVLQLRNKLTIKNAEEQKYIGLKKFKILFENLKIVLGYIGSYFFLDWTVFLYLWIVMPIIISILVIIFLVIILILGFNIDFSQIVYYIFLFFIWWLSSLLILTYIYSYLITKFDFFC